MCQGSTVQAVCTCCLWTCLYSRIPAVSAYSDPCLTYLRLLLTPSRATYVHRMEGGSTTTALSRSPVHPYITTPLRCPHLVISSRICPNLLSHDPSAATIFIHCLATCATVEQCRLYARVVSGRALQSDPCRACIQRSLPQYLRLLLNLSSATYVHRMMEGGYT